MFNIVNRHQVKTHKPCLTRPSSDFEAAYKLLTLHYVQQYSIHIALSTVSTLIGKVGHSCQQSNILLC